MSHTVHRVYGVCITDTSCIVEEDLLEMLKQVQERKRMRGKQDVQSIDLKRKDSAGKRRPISERINFEKREMVDESVSSPKFVVTLDGVADMSKLLPQKNLDDDDDIDLLDDTLDSDLADMKAEIRGSLDFSTPSKVGEEAKNLSSILCRLLPNCRAGRRCPFMHPPCKNFPNCKFGDQCVYTHPTSAAPPCKFDSRCTKPRCPFTHSVKVHNPGMVLAQLSKAPLPLPTKPVGKTVCKFHPKCSNMDCQYLHPKPCRFGLSCAKRNKGCIFTHPSLPTKSQLKWTKSSLGISDQEG
ncbi:ZC3H14 [Bugula neritina]|uniref:Zinc finger CCCH domain-containing protein 14 n=1 Tax=Bugula neritina TaxID=10212 RepID=A0A7J7KEM9_BUGNE|nr:ZC3H14 [Bugula neritina]